MESVPLKSLAPLFAYLPGAGGALRRAWGKGAAALCPAPAAGAAVAAQAGRDHPHRQGGRQGLAPSGDRAGLGLHDGK